MLFSSQAHHYQHGDLLVHSDHHDKEGVSTDDSPGESIPHRYRDKSGGINIEQVRKDQLRARQQVVQAALKRFKKIWHR